ncbi:unnamed protein product [marine sediment metagenome]|uniref:Uncharacterized protein n=1 Tax=marine sediment metagenome TaxID=412755 RepID=X1CAM2_9ZZZZ
MDPGPDPGPDPIPDPGPGPVVNVEIHKIEIEAVGRIPVLVGESILLMVRAYNYPEMQEVRLDTGDTILWSENCNKNVLDPLVGFSTTLTAKEVGEYQVSACYKHLCTGITIYVVEE